ncbi:MAG: hypothetical protein KatS3mg050_0219 [Litorilinea sp.]|nr:MAG: hypothetical protein KatS3mg050_0219 [Litorilinea sp.]
MAETAQRVERLAMEAVLAAERALGYEPADVSRENRGYDIESHHPPDPQAPLRFIEVKGRIQGAPTVTLTRNELLCALNKQAQWILALVQVPPSDAVGEAPVVRYVAAHHVARDPGFAAVGVNLDLDRLWEVGYPPTP